MLQIKLEEVTFLPFRMLCLKIGNMVPVPWTLLFVGRFYQFHWGGDLQIHLRFLVTRGRNQGIVVTF